MNKFTVTVLAAAIMVAALRANQEYPAVAPWLRMVLQSLIENGDRSLAIAPVSAAVPFAESQSGELPAVAMGYGDDQVATIACYITPEAYRALRNYMAERAITMDDNGWFSRAVNVGDSTAPCFYGADLPPFGHYDIIDLPADSTGAARVYRIRDGKMVGITSTVLTPEERQLYGNTP